MVSTKIARQRLRRMNEMEDRAKPAQRRNFGSEAMCMNDAMGVHVNVHVHVHNACACACA